MSNQRDNPSRPPSRRARQSDIARIAGVSQATVSIVLRGKSGQMEVGDATRERVLEVARQLHYMPNTAAQSLAGGRTGLLGVYSFESVFPVDNSDFYQPFLTGIEHQAELLGHDLLFFTSATAADGQRAIFKAGASRLHLADGCILLGKSDDKVALARLAEERYPFVYIGHRDVVGQQINFVAPDNTAATVTLVNHLLDLGHRLFSYIAPTDQREPFRDRLAGFTSALSLVPSTEYGIHPEEGSVTPEWVEERLQEGTTAFLCEDHLVAESLADALKQLGLSMPEDVSAAVLGDADSTVVAGNWTRYELPREEIGRQAVDLLVRILARDESDDALQVFTPCPFYPGETTGPVK